MEYQPGQQVQMQPTQPYGQPPMQPAQPYGAPPPVVTAQPAVMNTTTTTVITSAPAALRPWKSGLCDCCQDIKSCLCSFICSNFYYACVSTRMGENCCVGCSGDDAGCVPGGHIAMRTRVRAQYGIQGNICDDCCMMHFCKPCAMSQISRELNGLGYPDNC